MFTQRNLKRSSLEFLNNKGHTLQKKEYAINNIR